MRALRKGRVPLPVLLVGLVVGACGGEPPEGLGGFLLGMTQSEVMEEAYSRDEFVCRLVASRPKLTLCAGPTGEGMLEVLVRGDSAVQITLEVGREAEDPTQATRRFAGPFGDPAWFDRPYPPASQPPESYHTFWLNEDSTRGIAMMCRGKDLEPPCNARLTTTSPARVEAKLDSLLNIRR